MNYIKGIFHYLPGLTNLLQSKKMAGIPLAIHWFLAYLLVDFAIEIYSMKGAGEPIISEMLVFDMFLIGSISLFLVSIFYGYFLFTRTYQLITD